MNIKNRLNKIEDKLGINSNLCACPREIVFKVIPYEERMAKGEELPAMCAGCGKRVPTFDEATFRLGGNVDINVIEPSVNFTREEFEAWQNRHVVSEHMTYEDYLAEKGEQL